MRKEFAEVKTRKLAADKCPWASFFLKAEGGYWCFEFVGDYQIHVAQR